MSNMLSVGMGEIKLANRPEDQLVCLGLGSCIGVIAVDQRANIAGMVHVMLPESFKDRPVDQLGKFADTGIPELLRQLEAAGAVPRRLQVALSGGAQVFSFSNNNQNSSLNIGERNAKAVTEQLLKHGLRPCAMDVGGTKGRTMTYDAATGSVTVKTISQGLATLCTLPAIEPILRKVA